MERGELRGSGRNLANREMFDYIRGENMVKNHKVNNVISLRCLSVDFVKKVDFSEPEVSQDEFPMDLR